MKRLLTLGFAVMAFGASVFASGNSSLVEKLNSETTQKAVARYLNVDFRQNEDLKYVFNESAKKMNRELAKGVNADVAHEKAMNFNLANAKAVLSNDQYRKFVTVLNATMNNGSAFALLAEK